MKINLIDNGYAAHAKMLKTRIDERIAAEYAADGMPIALGIDAKLGEAESYRITLTDGVWSITGTDALGLYHGIGKFLHSAKWSEHEFVPVATDGLVVPYSKYRAIYFSMHFYNWYQMAPADELERYLEDLMLWGYNTIHCTLPTINCETFEDEVFVNAVANLRKVYMLAKKNGMKTSLSLGGNQGLKSAPHAYDADFSYDQNLRGNLGRNLCMSNPDAVEYLKGIWRHKLHQFEDIGLDYVTCWPYDEGGCGCANCRPWGANKYPDLCKLVREEAKKVYPNVQVIVSTWAFDATKDEGEYAGLYARLNGDMSVIDYLMVDAHGDFPRYPLEHEPIKPIVNFPEISMWGLAPWGGFGANPLPERFQRIWDSSKQILKGGMPYSEGIYEDISKVQCVGYYWDPDRKWQDILAEYINYEYSADVIDDVLALMLLIEKNHTHIGNQEKPDTAASDRAAELAASIDARLPEKAKNAWRWRILYIRAMVDKKRYDLYESKQDTHPKFAEWFIYYSGDLLLEDNEAQEMFLELQRWYHCVPHNGENHHTLPPAGGTKLDVVV